MSEGACQQCTGTRHIVLVPGFFGFDALGQIEYYAGTTEVFSHWRTGIRQRVTLHYFDNYPTASVTVRAQRLHSYLAKKIDRGEIATGDRIALVGHSTGGLDIRRMLFLLAEQTSQRGVPNLKTRGSKEGEGVSMPYQAEAQLNAPLAQPGAEVMPPTSAKDIAVSRADAAAGPHGESDAPVSGERILEFVDRVVFLSVPHYGSGLADFATGLQKTFQAGCAALRIVVEANQGMNLDSLKELLHGQAQVRADFLLAFLDALSESDERPNAPAGGAADPLAIALECAIERENRSAFCLWLEHMSKDFGVVFDLSSAFPAPTRQNLPASPAHFSHSERVQEIAYWAAKNITTRSFVTYAPLRPPALAAGEAHGAFPRPGPGSPAAIARWSADTLRTAIRSFPRGVGSTLGSLQDLARLLWAGRRETTAIEHALKVVGQSLQRGEDPFFRTFQSLCAREALATSIAQLRNWSYTPQALLDELTRRGVDERTSDGVVNTISMVYPFDGANRDAHAWRIVEDCDHADIIGHHTRVEQQGPTNPEGRKFKSYDIFYSRSGFGAERFRKVWTEVFDDCLA